MPQPPKSLVITGVCNHAHLKNTMLYPSNTQKHHVILFANMWGNENLHIWLMRVQTDADVLESDLAGFNQIK